MTPLYEREQYDPFPSYHQTHLKSMQPLYLLFSMSFLILKFGFLLDCLLKFELGNLQLLFCSLNILSQIFQST